MLKKLHLLPVERHPVSKTASLVYTFLHTGFARILTPYISSYSNSYSTRRSQSGGNSLVVSKIQPFFHKSVKQFGYSFAFDAPTVWNALPDEICTSPFTSLFQKAAQNLPVHQGINTLVLLIPSRSL